METIIAILFILSAVLNLILIQIFKNTSEELRRVSKRLESVLKENESLFFDQLKRGGVKLSDLDYN